MQSDGSTGVTDRAVAECVFIEGENVPGNTQRTAAFVMIVKDGGTPGSAGELVSLVRSSTPIDCAGFNVARRPVTHGNLVVHHD